MDDIIKVAIFGGRNDDIFMYMLEKRLVEKSKYSILRQKLPIEVTEDKLSEKGVLYASFELINKADVLVFVDGYSDKLLIELGYAYAKNKYIIGIKNNIDDSVDIDNLNDDTCSMLCTEYINRKPEYISMSDNITQVTDKYGYVSSIANEISEYIDKYYWIN